MIQSGSRVLIGPFWLFSINNLSTISDSESLHGTVIEQISTDEYVDQMMARSPDFVRTYEATIRDQRAWRIRIDKGTVGLALEQQLWPENDEW